MNAIVYEKYGPPGVLEIREIDKPVPKADEVLIRNHAASVTRYDCWMRSSTSPPGFGLMMRLATGLLRPKQPILGMECAGEVEAAGKDVMRFKKGDKVFAYLGMKLGAYAQYICIPEDGVLAPKPPNLTFEEATAVQQGALTALYFLKNGKIGKGQKVLVYGASGGVGAYAVQLAGYFGAGVTGVCSTQKMDWVKSLGAEKVIDYTREDFTKGNDTYDIVFDTVGKTSISRTRKLLKNEGRYLFTTFGLPKLFRILGYQMTGGKAFYGTLEEKTKDLLFLKGLLETGKIRAVVDKIFPMEEAVEAHRYVESGEKKGSVVITISTEN
jgi:NADPH:quinone reductase-like Zn-dependent oxidoreductase